LGLFLIKKLSFIYIHIYIYVKIVSESLLSNEKLILTFRVHCSLFLTFVVYTSSWSLSER